MPYLPRICAIDADGAVAPADIENVLDRCTAMGFDHVLIGPGDDERILRIAGACRSRGLQLLVDFDPGSIAADQALVEQQPAWFDHPGMHDDLPDPRRRPLHKVRPRVRHEQDAVREALLGHWMQRLRSWLAAGVHGLRCLGLTEAPPAFWQGLVERARRIAPVRFLAWTPGCTPEQVRALTGCGFDASFSSSDRKSVV